MGLKTHLFHVIRAWAGAVELTVFGFCLTETEVAGWKKFSREVGFRLGGLSPVHGGSALRARQAGCLLTGRPLAEARYEVRAARVAVQTLIDEAAHQGSPFDWVAFEVFHTLMPLRLPAGTRQLLFPVDCYSLYYERMHAWASTPGEWVRTAYLKSACRRMESRRYRGLDVIATVAEPDASALRRLRPEARVEVVGVPACAQVRRKAGARPGPVRVLAAGYFGIPTVAHDMRLFLESWAARPDRPHRGEVELIVWGRGGAKAGLPELCRKAGAELVEWVEDYAGFLASGDVYVYPQRFACGVQTKVQQAMAAGLAVVAVPEVLGPLAARDGSHARAIREPAGGAEEVIRLAGERRRIDELGEAGARLMEQRFSVPGMENKLRQLLGVPLAVGVTETEEAAGDVVFHR